MLEQLRRYHTDALAAADAIDNLVRNGVPDMAALATARLKLMAVSRDRLTFLEGEIYPALLMDRENRDILALREDARLSMTEAAVHIARWNSPEIAKHWDEYLRAAHEIRQQVRRRIRTEISVLYPLLERHRGPSQRKAA